MKMCGSSLVANEGLDDGDECRACSKTASTSTALSSTAFSSTPMGSGPSRPAIYPPSAFDTYGSRRRRAYSLPGHGYPFCAYPLAARDGVRLTGVAADPQQPAVAPVVVTVQNPPVQQQQPMFAMAQPFQMPAMQMPAMQMQMPVPAPGPPPVVPAAVVPVMSSPMAPFPGPGHGHAQMPEPRVPRHRTPRRRRFTDFYRQPNAHVHVEHDDDDDEGPFRPPSAPPGVHSVHHHHHNPLPTPPRDVWQQEPYRETLEGLERPLPSLHVDGATQMMFVADDVRPPPRPHQPPTSFVGNLFGSRKDKGRKRRSFGGHHPHDGHTSFVFMPPQTQGGGRPAPIKFNHLGELAGFVNHSPYRVMHGDQTYPTAIHLFEALKFPHRPDIMRQIRETPDVNAAYALSSHYQAQARSDWGQVFLGVVRVSSFRVCSSVPR